MRKNERSEWELPGGKLDPGEQPEETVVREMREELGFLVAPLRLVDAYVYVIQTSIDESKGVLVVSYVCTIVDRVGGFELVGEAGVAEFATFTLDKVQTLHMPSFYKNAIIKSLHS